MTLTSNLLPNHKAEDIMTREVVTLTPETDLYEAMSLLLSRNISGAPVVDDASHLVGVLSEKDCLRVLTGEGFNGFPEGRVVDYMSPEPVTVSPLTSLFDVVAIFLDRHFRRLPVVEKGGRLVGQISRRDALRAIESIREHYLQPPQPELEIDIEAEGLVGVHSAMAMARAL